MRGVLGVRQPQRGRLITRLVCRRRFSAASSRYSLNPTQNKDNMDGRSFLRIAAGGYVKLQDIELAGCYSTQGGACVQVLGGKLETERVGFAASFSAVWLPASPSTAQALPKQAHQGQ